MSFRFKNAFLKLLHLQHFNNMFIRYTIKIKHFDLIDKKCKNEDIATAISGKLNRTVLSKNKDTGNNYKTSIIITNCV